MSQRAIVYDLSRLATRVLNRTPNGIDRIDDLLAGHFLDRTPAWPLLFGLNGPRIGSNGLDTVRRVRASWGETAGGEAASARNERILETIASALDGAKATAPFVFRAKTGQRSGPVLANLARHGLMRGREPARSAPRDAIYLNATHFPVEWRRHIAWLDQRQDVRPVLFVHDVLPVSRPGMFWPGEPERHRRRLQFLAQRGAGALVTSSVVETELRRFLASSGRPDLPIFRATPPVAETFVRPAALSRRPASPFFVVCGTIEPRKNHLLLARVWRRLVRRLGPDAPRLLVVGKRGWSTEPIVAALHAADIGTHVVEASGMPTPVYRSLLGCALALLTPSFDEGFGLPLAEALSAGVPALASDIPSHREQAGGRAHLLDPADEDGWFETVAAFADPASDARRSAVERAAAYEPVSAERYLADIEAFLEGL